MKLIIDTKAIDRQILRDIRADLEQTEIRERRAHGMLPDHLQYEADLDWWEDDSPRMRWREEL